MTTLRPLGVLTSLALIWFLVGCGASKEEVHLSSELALAKERAELATKEIATQKVAVERLTAELMTSKAALAANEAEIGRLKERLTQKDSEIASIRKAAKEVEAAEKLRVKRNDDTKAILTSLRRIRANLIEGSPSSVIKPLIAETYVALDGFAVSENASNQKFNEKARHVLAALSDLIGLNAARDFSGNRDRPIGSLGSMYALEGDPGWDLVSRWDFPKDRVKQFDVVVPGFTPQMHKECVLWTDLRDWIDESVVRKILVELSNVTN